MDRGCRERDLPSPDLRIPTKAPGRTSACASITTAATAMAHHMPLALDKTRDALLAEPRTFEAAVPLRPSSSKCDQMRLGLFRHSGMCRWHERACVSEWALPHTSSAHPSCCGRRAPASRWADASAKCQQVPASPWARLAWRECSVLVLARSCATGAGRDSESRTTGQRVCIRADSVNARSCMVACQRAGAAS